MRVYVCVCVCVRVRVCVRACVRIGFDPGRPNRCQPSIVRNLDSYWFIAVTLG